MVSISASKQNLINELFVRTADENYVAARWCVINRLNTDFFWLSVHALEKYLKAVLLTNGRSGKVNEISGKRYRHNIVDLYRAVQSLAGPLLPNTLSRPATLEIGHWLDRTPEEFIEHLLSNGNADNRYLIYGYVTRSPDLHMLDAMVFAVRRLICPLDERVLQRRDPQTPTFTHRDLLRRQPEYYARMAMPLDEIISSREDTDVRAAAMNLNMAFAPTDYQHEPMLVGTSSRNPVIMRRILDPLESNDPVYAAEGIVIARWFLANVQVPGGTPSDPGVKKQIETAIKAARAKHGLN